MQPKMRYVPQRESSGIFFITAPMLIATESDAKCCESTLPRAPSVLHCLAHTACGGSRSQASKPFCNVSRGKCRP